MEFEKSRIERLKRSLYSRDDSRVPQEKRTPVSSPVIPEEDLTPRDWGEKPSLDVPYEDIVPAKRNSFFEHFFGISLIFFCVSLGVAIFIFFGGFNMISSSNVDIKITGPSSVASGDELDADLTVLNGNRTELQNATLYIDYPEGTRATAGVTTLGHDKISLGTIPAGKTGNYSLRAVFFGQTNSLKTVHVTLEYGVKGSTATFSKDKSYDISLGSAPLLLNVTYPKQVDSGEQMTLTVDLTSNSNAVVPHTLVKIEYPYGFTFASASQKPTVGNALWDVGDLKNGDKKTLSITGALVGQDNEQRSFRVSVGTKSNDPNKDFDALLGQSDATIAINKSFFNLSLTSSNPSLLSNIGQSVPVTITWQNTLPEKILNGVVVATISGNVVNRSSVSASNGFYRSLDNTVTWDKNSLPILSVLSFGDTGQTSLYVSSIADPVIVRSIKNPHIDISVVMRGNRVTDNASSISSSGNITIKLSSILALVAQSSHATSAFTTTGPIPPRADKQSTYGITWTLSNTSNDLTGGIVSATLPVGVSWIGKVIPSSESVVYNPDTRVVVWNVGSLSSGTGFSLLPKTITFEVGLTPSITSVGQSAALTSVATASAHDSYTNATLSASAQTVTTRYSDPSFKSGDDIILK